jgi:hypothetical protein
LVGSGGLEISVTVAHDADLTAASAKTNRHVAGERHLHRSRSFFIHPLDRGYQHRCSQPDRATPDHVVNAGSAAAAVTSARTPTSLKIGSCLVAERRGLHIGVTGDYLTLKILPVHRIDVEGLHLQLILGGHDSSVSRSSAVSGSA